MRSARESPSTTYLTTVWYGVCAELICGCACERPPRSHNHVLPFRVKSSSSLSCVRAMGVTDRVLHVGTYQSYYPAAINGIGQINVLDLRWQRDCFLLIMLSTRRDNDCHPRCVQSRSFVVRRTIPPATRQMVHLFRRLKTVAYFRCLNISIHLVWVFGDSELLAKGVVVLVLQKQKLPILY